MKVNIFLLIYDKFYISKTAPSIKDCAAVILQTSEYLRRLLRRFPESKRINAAVFLVALNFYFMFALRQLRRQK